jgi:hypothetical protein
MKCDDCQNLLAEYVDGELLEPEAERISAHLITCAGCAKQFELMTAEQDLFARYDRELDISPAMWSAIQARTVSEKRAVEATSKTNARAWLAGIFAAPRFGFAFSGAMAVLIAAVVIGVMYLRTQPQITTAPGSAVANTPGQVPPPPIFNTAPNSAVPSNAPIPPVTNERPANVIASAKKGTGRVKKSDDPGVLLEDVAYSDLAERDTAEHIQQAENLLRSVRSLQAADGDAEIDVSYEKAMSRRLLSENQMLRQDAEKAGKFPTKELLGDLEPFLIDIANLPDKATPDKLRAIKDRVQKTEIVAALVSY